MSDPQDQNERPEAEETTPEGTATPAAPEPAPAPAPEQSAGAAEAAPEAGEAADEPEALAEPTPAEEAPAQADAGGAAPAGEAEVQAPSAEVGVQPAPTAEAQPEAAPARESEPEHPQGRPEGVRLRRKKSLYANDVQPGADVEGVFMVRRKQLPVDRTGSVFLAVTLADKSGKLEARLWDDPETVAAGFREGDYVQLKGQAVTWQGRLQVRVTELTKVDLQEVGLPATEFVSESKRPADRMFEEVVSIVDRMEDRHLKALLHLFLDDPEEAKRFKRAPAAQSVHHAWIGGLLEHTLSTMRLGERLCDHYPHVNRDLVLAGCFFHDYGKTAELDYESGISYSDAGRLVGHLVLCSQWIHARAAQVTGFPQGLLDQLVHIVISHHGALEFGSPKRPKTLEALLVHHADVLDARVASFTELLEDAGPEGWTDYNRIYDRPLYRGDGGGAGAPVSKSAKKRKKRKRKKKGPEEGARAGTRPGGAPKAEQGPKEPREPRKPRDSRESREPREPRETREPRERRPRKGKPEGRQSKGGAPQKAPLTFNPFAALASQEGESGGEAAPAQPETTPAQGAEQAPAPETAHAPEQAQSPEKTSAPEQAPAPAETGPEKTPPAGGTEGGSEGDES